MKKYSIAFLLVLGSFSSFAQSQKVEMADVMRSNGMIYVVVAVLGIILLGVIGYLISIDKKISKLEKEIDR
ncbi:MAG: CcmD family protein [Microscillaceae bacterium]|nr:CcmD family protein [Microscillaceae bacterium]